MKTIKVRNLTTKNIESLQRQLRQYEKQLFAKCKLFCNKLADVGISVAYENDGVYAGHITYTKKIVTESEDSYKIVFVGKKKHDLVVCWRTKNGIKSANVDPLLMAEFGSGWYADDKLGFGAGGQGTFPNQKHAFDPQGWFWVDLKGEKHHSMGQLPTYPMYKAWLAMQTDIDMIAKEVFSK